MDFPYPEGPNTSVIRNHLWRRRPPPSAGGDQLCPSVKEVGIDAQLLSNRGSGLATVEPILDGLSFKGMVEFASGLDGFRFDGLNHTRFCPIVRASNRGNLTVSRVPVVKRLLGLLITSVVQRPFETIPSRKRAGGQLLAQAGVSSLPRYARTSPSVTSFGGTSL